MRLFQIFFTYFYSFWLFAFAILMSQKVENNNEVTSIK